MTTREREWWVPKWGPERFRLFVGMTFFPYTAMNVSYPVIGAMFAPAVHWDRVGVIALVYFFGLGISAHALDARGANKPWGRFLNDGQLLALALVFFILAVGLGVYYAVVNGLILIWLVGLAEIFYLFAYNLELLGGRYHTDRWFAFSWGFLPILAGYFMQTDILSLTPFIMGAVGFTTAYVEISASRPYRANKKSMTDLIEDPEAMSDNIIQLLHAEIRMQTNYYERILKSIVLSVILLAIVLVLMRM